MINDNGEMEGKKRRFIMKMKEWEGRIGILTGGWEGRMMDLAMEGRINKDNRERIKGNWWKGRMETMEKRNIDDGLG